MAYLKEFRLKSGYSQERFARKVNVTLSYYAQVERGHVQAGRGFMQKLKAAFPSASIDRIFFSDVREVTNATE